MLSIDTNLIVYALNRGCPEHEPARSFLHDLSTRDDVAICELALVEVYVLLRNPAVFRSPGSAAEAVTRIQPFRAHPRWRLVDFPGHVPEVMDELWRLAAAPSFARRQIFDARLALTLRHHGVDELATANPKHFGGFGFRRVFDPLA